MVVTLDGTITYESSAVERVLGYEADGRTGQSLLTMAHRDDRARVEELLTDVARTPDGLVSGEVRLRHADGSWRWVEMLVKNLLEDSAIAGIVVNYRDVTGRRMLEDELRHQAFHDSLTGLPNRALFLDRLSHGLPAGGASAVHWPSCLSTSMTSRQSTTALATPPVTTCLRQSPSDCRPPCARRHDRPDGR
jgi:PAS domain S-box-containing protein